MRNTHAEISLANLRHNIRVIRRGLKPGTKYLAVVKADAYGHGMEQIAGAALREGADYLAAAFCEEGVRLRSAGFEAPVLLLGATDEAHVDDVIKHDLIPTVFSIETLRQLRQRAAALGRPCRFHMKVDTGMNRLGFTSHEEFARALALLDDCPDLVFEGLFTHFAVSEIPDASFTLLQAERFDAFVRQARAAGYSPMLHASNSGAALRFAQLQYDMVRGGIAMYGYHPAGVSAENCDLKPVLCWKTAISQIKAIHSGDTVSYGRKFTAKHDMLIATLPVGYGDGYKRNMSGKAEVLIRGRRAPQIGTICMDQMMCDISDIPDARVGDEVILIGAQGGAVITADDVAEWADTISYEILLSIDNRVPRVYLKD